MLFDRTILPVIVFLALAFCSVGRGENPKPILVGPQKAEGEFVLRGLNHEVLANVEKWQKNDPRWQQVLEVHVAKQHETPLLGVHAVTQGELRFRPRYPLRPGVSYHVSFAPSVLGLAGNPVEISHAIDEPEKSPAARLVSVFPSSPVLPENLLKFYLHFSAPMSIGDSYRHIRLLDDEGKTVELPFLELPQELWNKEATRLTLLFDPGRVKEGLKPRLESGQVLMAGVRYTLVVDESWTDASGQPLGKTYEHPFVATAPDAGQPDPSAWKIIAPQAGTVEPLVVRFNESLDHAMLERVLEVLNPAGAVVQGTVAIEAMEKVWRFRPRVAWTEGDHTLSVMNILEDNAGNSIGRPFELDLNDKSIQPLSQTQTLLAFAVASPSENSDADIQEDAALLRNWHQWRGPLANGTSPLADPPTTWSEEKNIKWKTPIPGAGSATPIVWEDKIFVVTAEQTEREAEDPPKADPRARTTPPKNYHRFLLVCLDRETGKVLWESEATQTVPHEGLHQTNTYAAASPMTDGKHVYVSFGSRGVYCFDFAGKQLWTRDFGKMRTRSGWGEGASPVVHEGKVVVNWDHEDDSALFVLDAATGETIWETKRDEPTSWATPFVTRFDGKTQLIQNATNRVRGYDLETGEILWQCGGQTVNTIPSPVRFQNTVICMSGYQGNLATAIPLDSTGDITDEDKTVWSISRNTPYVPSPVLYENLLFFNRANANVLTCLDAATGQTILSGERLDGLGNIYASPVAAAGKVYFTDRSGKTMVIKAGRPFEILAVNELSEPVDASPVLIGNRILIRSHQSVYCIEAP